MNYLEIVNKALNEAATELDPLTLGNWSSMDAGRRQYPAFKRAVSEAWKIIQMERNEWQFKDEEMYTLVYPRIKITEGERLAGPPPVGTVFRGQTSGFQFTVRQVIADSGDWTLGTATAQLEFDQPVVGSQLLPGEIFAEVTPVLNDGHFLYLSKGSYDFTEINPNMREPLWTTFVASQDTATPIPVVYIPWENWLYKELSFVQGSRTVPNYLSQDFEGNIVFYPQTLQPFRISFVHTTAPQILEDPEDEPALLQAEYHDYIAWRALMRIARFDKNPDQFADAQAMASIYEKRMERNLMPIPSWGSSVYNYQRRP